MSQDEREKPAKILTCPECQAGVMHKRYLPYFTWLYHDLISVPEFPAWVCDVCGRRDYDPRAITWLNILLDPGTGRKASRPAPRKDLPPERPPAQP